SRGGGSRRPAGSRVQRRVDAPVAPHGEQRGDQAGTVRELNGHDVSGADAGRRELLGSSVDVAEQVVPRRHTVSVVDGVGGKVVQEPEQRANGSSFVGRVHADLRTGPGSPLLSSERQSARFLATLIAGSPPAIR